MATRPVIVAAVNLDLGAELRPEDVRIVEWPATAVPATAFASADEVVGRGLILPVVANEPILSNKLAAKGAGSGLPPIIPAGMRAISVRVNEVVGVAGFVVPGTRVDVIVSVDDPGAGNGAEPMARTVISNVLVLTAGTRYDRQPANGNEEPQRASVVTLAVLPEDGERIALASVQGTLSLALRNPVDADPTQTPGIKLAMLMRGPGAQPVLEQRENRVVAVRRRAPAPVVPVVAPAVYRVETIRAAKRADEVVR